jgi:hypothetical protein
LQSIQIAMLGPRAVGKTSLLTAMYQEFQSNLSSAALKLSVDTETSAILQERLIELKNLIRGGSGIAQTSGEVGLDGLRKRSFNFRLGKAGQAPSMELRFKDYPGGFMSSHASQEERSFVQHLVFHSVATVIPIDAAALMEANGQFHEWSNRPMEVTEYVKTGFENLDSPRLVILAPTKCERYMQELDGPEKLLERVREEYADLLGFLASDSLRSKVAVAITPVQTVGDLAIARVDSENGLPKFTFRPLPRGKYAPKDCEQPLRYLLSFLLRMHIEQRSWKAFDFLRSLLKLDEHLRIASAEFAGGCKDVGGFAVLQGKHLVESAD